MRHLHHSTAAGRAPAAVLVALILTGAAPSAARRGEGTVVVARGSPILLDEGGSPVLVALSPAASLSGINHTRELRPGDHVAYRWRTVAAGVRMAEELAADPIVGSDPVYTFRQDELAVAMQQGRAPALLDARPTGEFRLGHLPGARSLPAGAGPTDVAKAIPPDRGIAVVVYGRDLRDDSGHRLARALLAAGATDVKVLLDGVQGWIDAAHPLELDPGGVTSAMNAFPTLTVIDTRPRAVAAVERPAGSVSVPPEAFRWQDFDGALPLPHLILVGANASDRSALDVAERVRALRAGGSVKPPVRLHVLTGGFEAWKRAGLAIARGGEPHASIPYRALSSLEIPMEEFDALWKLQGGSRATFLDVRRVGTSAEPWVVKIPLEDLPARIGELPRDREVVAYCTVGERSRVAAELLKSNGLRARFLRAQPGR